MTTSKDLKPFDPNFSSASGGAPESAGVSIANMLTIIAGVTQVSPHNFQIFVEANLATYAEAVPDINLNGQDERESIMLTIMTEFVHHFLGHYIRPSSFAQAADAIGEAIQSASICATRRGNNETYAGDFAEHPTTKH